MRKTKETVYDVIDVSDILKVSVRWVHNLMASGKLKTITVTDKNHVRAYKRIPRECLIDYLHENNAHMSRKQLERLIK